MLIYKGLFTLAMIIIAILSSTPFITTVPDKKNIIKPKTPPKKRTGTNSKYPTLSQQVFTTITVNKKKVIFERKEKGRETVISSFILNSEGQFIADDNSEGEEITSVFGIKAQDVPLDETEGDKVKVSNSMNSDTAFEKVNTVFLHNSDLLIEKCVHLFTQPAVSDRLYNRSRTILGRESRFTPESTSFSRHCNREQGRFI